MGSFGESLKNWRKAKGLSQLQLSLAANISSKHVSFLETGRANPSREMVIQLSNALDIPLNERNLLLTQSGFAEAYRRTSLDSPDMSSVRMALETILANHDPYPALVMDWDWNILLANEAQQKLTALLVQQQPNYPDTCNVMELLFDPNGYRPFIENWDEVAQLLLQRIYRESKLYQERHSKLLDRLLNYPNIPKQWKQFIPTEQVAPMVQIVLNLNGQKLKLFSTLASFGTVIDITMQELIIEQYFPFDDNTKNFFEI